VTLTLDKKKSGSSLLCEAGPTFLFRDRRLGHQEGHLKRQDPKTNVVQSWVKLQKVGHGTGGVIMRLGHTIYDVVGILIKVNPKKDRIGKRSHSQNKRELVRTLRRETCRSEKPGAN